MTFKDIFGQATAVSFLRQAWANDRVPHGLIFAGPVGVGKGTTALALASLFLCASPTDDMPCRRCESCRLFENGGAHPDYHVIAKELIRYHDKTGKSKGIDLSIHVIRPELIEPANRKAVMGHGKVFVVEQAELMNAAAQNAMLKTLEEPAGRTVIVLLTDAPEGLMQTVRSRCQRVVFGSLPRADLLKKLVERGVDSETAETAATLSQGSLGGALRLIDDGLIGPARELWDLLDALRAGQAPVELPAWFKAAADAYAERQLARDPLSSKDAATRTGLGLFMKFAAQRLSAALNERSNAAALERLCSAIDAIARAEMYLDANVNVAIVLHQLTQTLTGAFARA